MTESAPERTVAAAAVAPDAPASQPPPRRPRWRAVLLVLVALLLLGLVIVAVGPAAVADSLAGVAWSLIALVALVVAATTLLGAVNAWQLSALHGRVGLPRFVPAFWSAWAVGLVVPGQVGDLVWLATLLRRLGIPLSEAVGRLGVDKLIALLVTLSAAASLQLATGDPRLRVPALVAAVGAAALLIAVVAAPGVANWIRSGARTASAWRRNVADTIMQAGDVVRRSPHRVAINLALSVLKLGLTGLSYWITFTALGQGDLSWWRVTVIAASAGLIAYLPISFNGMGTVEFAGVLMFATLNLPAPVVTSAYLLLRAVNLAVAWIPVAFLLPVLVRRSEA